MVNINGNIIPEEQAFLSLNNRGFVYGDAVFETLKVIRSKPLFLEDHYFRLMASMRILRMEIKSYDLFTQAPFVDSAPFPVLSSP